MSKFNLSLIFIFFLCLADCARADIITLKSGKIIEGKIVEKTDEYVKIDTGAAALYFKLNYIAQISGGEAAISVPAIEEVSRQEAPAQDVSLTPAAPQQAPPAAAASEDMSPEIPLTVKDVKFYLKTGLKCAADGKFGEAEVIFLQGLKLSPRDHNLGEVLKMIGDLKAGKMDRDYALCLFRGSNYLINAQYSQAAGEFEKGLKIAEGDPDLYYYLGISYFSLERYRQAVDHLKRALSAEAGLDQVYFYLGLSYYSLGEYRQAIDYLSKNLQVNPEDAEAYSVIGMSNFMLGDVPQARENLLKANGLFRRKGDYLNAADIEDFLNKLDKPM